MKFLISTQPNDVHAIVVKLALEEIGHHVRFLFHENVPTKQAYSVYFDSDETDQSIFSDINDDYDVVWWRRTSKPYIPEMELHRDDYQFVLNENVCFMEGLTNNMAPNAWWINTKEAANRADSKLYQLKIADECGIHVPKTLFSNNPSNIRDFILKHEAKGVIFKPFCSNFWTKNHKIRASYTTNISMNKLGSDKLLQLSPGIYQQQIIKKYEIRVVCFGDYLVAVKLNSQCHPEGLLDWRAIHPTKLLVDECVLPFQIENNIRLFMNKLGIVFGSFDFIVTPDDDYVFLEVNEQGQFLWIEELNPNIPLLDIFVNFIVHKSRKFLWQPQPFCHGIKQYKNRIKTALTSNLLHH